MPSVTDMAQMCLEPLLQRIGDRPFALFGHSMGALLCLELTYSLVALGQPPQLVVISGAAAPELPSAAPVTQMMSDDEFLAYVAGIGGTSAEVFDDSELRAVMLPILRNDFTACERYEFRHRPRLPVPALVLGGTDDPIAPPPTLDGWREAFGGPVTVRFFPGGHFFVFDCLGEVLGLLSDRLG